ncbi:MAG: 50S ribosomal protein L15 [Planctomycetota bacterium]
MNIDDVHRQVTKNKKRRRVGRGAGSGRGKTAGRGHKGQKSRSGWSRNPVFQGGAMPLVRRVPKRGFNNRFAQVVGTVNVSDLERVFQSGDEVTLETLRAKSLAKSGCDVLKVLGDGELTKKLTVSAHRFSGSAKEKIEKAGGEAVVLPGKLPLKRRKKEASPIAQ